MNIEKRMTENERLFSSVLLTFILFFGSNSVMSILIGENEDVLLMHYNMTISFLVGMAGGVTFFIWTRPKHLVITRGEEDIKDRNISILKRALSEDEIELLDIIKESEGITQDSLRFRTGFSKSKVSALLTNLEKKDIISREKLGRTYKVSIGDWLKKD